MKKKPTRRAPKFTIVSNWTGRQVERRSLDTFLVIKPKSPLRKQQKQRAVNVSKCVFELGVSKSHYPEPAEVIRRHNFILDGEVHKFSAKEFTSNRKFKASPAPPRGMELWLHKDYLVEVERGSEPIHEEEMALLVFEYIAKREKRFQKLSQLSKLEQKLAKASRREPIPDEVKMFVWKRDEGRCVKCESREKLEFDHIIPVSKGGSSTARNLQLLCEKCNRSKSDSI